jgi:hypothetical protein
MAILHYSELLLSLWISECKVSPLPEFDHYHMIYTLKLFHSNLKPQRKYSGNKGLNCMYLSLPHIINPIRQLTVGGHHSHLLHNSRLVTTLFTYASMQVSNILFLLLASCSLILCFGYLLFCSCKVMPYYLHSFGLGIVTTAI